MKNTKPILLKHLDDPMRIISVSMNDFIAYVLPFFVGIAFDSLTIIPLTGVIVVYSTKRFLKRYPRYFFVRYMYWVLPTRRFNPMMKLNWPPSHQRFWVK